MKKAESFILGTRKSMLARWQTEHVKALLEEALPATPFEIQVFVTRGDRILDTPLPEIGGKGLFTLELENALHSGAIDLAVHSLKDLPTDSPDGITLGAIPERENPADVLVSRTGKSLAALPKRARIGTSSKRRAAQLLHFRPDFQIIDIRGNIDTRLAKALDPDGPYDGTILAYAGLHRLGREDAIAEILSEQVMLPAPGQGALGIQCRDELDSRSLFSSIAHERSTQEVTAERAFLAALGGGCSTPVAARGTIRWGRLMFVGRVLAPDGSQMIEVAGSDLPCKGRRLGEHVAQKALDQGALNLMGMESAPRAGTMPQDALLGRRSIGSTQIQAQHFVEGK